MDEKRIEFGVERNNCSCQTCKLNCSFMPGYLIPADLFRLIPKGKDPFAWAEANLLASPGALVMSSKTDESFRIPTLVPAVKADGSCIHFTAEELCDIHHDSPFGCAFFSCRPEPPQLSNKGLSAVYKAMCEQGLYFHIWRHLFQKKLIQKAPEILREEMRKHVLAQQT